MNGLERPNDPLQIWYVNYSNGEVERVTNDLNDYGGTSFGVTADSSTIATILSEWSSKIWLASLGEDETKAKKITNGKQDARYGLAYLPDGRVVYVNVVENADLWIMNEDGANGKALTSDEFFDSRPSVSPDGRYIVYESTRPDNLPHIWRMDVDGSNAKQLTTTEDYGPTVSPDGRWVVFNSWRTGNKALWKVPIDGGEATQVSDKVAFEASFSPDGKSIVCWVYDNSVTPPRNRAAILSFLRDKLCR